jgi:hypothetical protein
VVRTAVFFLDTGELEQMESRDREGPRVNEGAEMNKDITEVLPSLFIGRGKL